jgi:hypothetical protein
MREPFGIGILEQGGRKWYDELRDQTRDIQTETME